MHKSKIKFKAAVLFSLNSNLKMKTVEASSTLEKNQFLIKIKYSGICGSQLGEISGVKGKDKYLPHMLGHEASGIVIKKNSNSRKINIGDNVVLHWKPNSLSDAPSPIYTSKNCKINAGKLTTFNEYAIVPENRITKISKKIKMKEACLLGCSLTTAYGVLKNNAQIKKNSNILIWGGGAVGQSIIILSKLFKVNKIFVVEVNKKKTKLLKTLGADFVLNTQDKNFLKKFKIIAGELNYAIDTTGSKYAIESCYNFLPTQSKIILVGVPHYRKKIRINTLPLHFGKQITGSHGGEIVPEKDIPYLQSLIYKKKIKLNKLITNVIKFDKINFLLNKMKKNQILGKAIIKF